MPIAGEVVVIQYHLVVTFKTQTLSIHIKNNCHATGTDWSKTKLKHKSNICRERLGQ